MTMKEGGVIPNLFRNLDFFNQKNKRNEKNQRR